MKKPTNIFEAMQYTVEEIVTTPERLVKETIRAVIGKKKRASAPSKPVPKNVQRIRAIGAAALRQHDEMVKASKAKPVKKTKPVIEVTQVQADAIELTKLLRNTYKFPLEVEFKQASAISLTPRFVQYRLKETAPGFRLNQLEERLGDIARNVNSLRKGPKQPLSASVFTAGDVFIQLTRRDPQPHSWADRSFKRKAMMTCLGDYWEGTTRIPVMLDLGDKTTSMANGLICGGPSSGKTRLGDAGLIGLLESNGPSKLHVYAIETKVNAFEKYRDCPQMQAIVGDKDGVLPVLEQFAYWCTPKGAPNDGIHRLLIFDEFQDCIEDEDIGEKVLALMKRIMSKGREVGIRVWLATQIPDRDSFPPRLKGLTHWMAVCRIQNDDYMRRQLKVYGACDLVPKAEFIFSSENGQRTACSFYLDDAQVVASIAEIVAKYSGAEVGQGRGRSGAEVVKSGAEVVKKPVKSGAELVGQVGQSDSHSCNSISVSFPLSKTRQLTDQEALYVYQMADDTSINKLQVAVFGGTKNSTKGGWIRDALERGRVLHAKT